MKKKSYMNKDNIISDGVFDKIKKIFAVSKLKKDPIITKNVDKMNDIVDDLEVWLNDKRKELKMKPAKLPRYNASDFYK